MISCRNATVHDLPAILHIYNHMIMTTTAVYDYMPHTLQMREEWFAIKQNEGLPVFVAEEGQEVIGFSTLGPFRRWGAYKYSVENSVYVAPGSQ
jgi:L-amino acid N-acyltransferase YncA